jgi:hypothetical protein
MAHNYEFDDSGTLALQPPRVDIFAKASTATGPPSTSPQAATIFGAAAACPRAEDGRHERASRAPARRSAVGVHRAAVTRLVALSALALVTAVVALRPAAPDPSGPLRPRAGQGEKTLRARGEQPRDARALDAVRRPRTHKRARPHTAPRHHKPGRAQPRPTQRPAPPRPPAAPSFTAPRPAPPTMRVPKTPVLTVPMRVPRSAPPEFM